MTAAELIAFEEDIAAEFNAGKIKAPVHLQNGFAHELIRIFQDIRTEDWILCSWRSHWHCLLKGVPPAQLKAEIMAGHSIALCFPEYRILSSAIVGGILPIGVGLGMGIKRDGGDEHVHIFLGDMTAETGIAHECIKYATNFDLSVHFHIEDNGVSVCTDTQKVWGIGGVRKVDYFRYTSKWPHAGAGLRVQF
jgi:TPP-dependent pyruvate/acetoin dehydrogenase alpha subunit